MPRFKMLFFVFAYLHTFLQTCICAPPTIHHWKRKSSNTSSYVQSLSFFNTTVLSADGSSDHSPKLQTKVYVRPSTTSASNLTNRQIMGERRILTCKSRTATFHHSHCRHMKGVAYSIREYMSWCREPLPIGMPQPTFTLPSEARAMASSTGREDPSLHGDYGTCHMDEICVDSLYSIDYREGFRMIANCVKKKLFHDAGLWKDEWDDLVDREGEEFGDEDLNDVPLSSILTENSDVEAAEKGQNKDQWKGKKAHGTGFSNQTAIEEFSQALFSGKYASVVITQGDEGITPLEVREIGLTSFENISSELSEPVESRPGDHAGGQFGTGLSNDNTGGQSMIGSAIAEHTQSCTNCVDLKTLKPFALDTKALEVEVKMIGIGSTTLAGILWIALLSG